MLTFRFFVLFGFPACVIVAAILGICALRWLDMTRARRAHRAWGVRPGREVLRRRGGWHWRTAA